MFQNIFYKICWTFEQFCKCFCMFALPLCLWHKKVSFVFILLCFWTFSFSLFLEYLFFLCFCATTFAFRVDELLTGWSPDRATHGLPTVGHQCTVGVLAGTHRCDDSSRQDDESPKGQPYSAALHWCSAALIALLTCSLATLPNLTNAVYSSYDAGKSNQIETWLDVTCMAGKLNWSWHAPLSHASTLSQSQSCCWGVLSIFDSFTPSCLGISLPPCTVRFTCFLIRIISCPLTSITLLTVENLVFNFCLLFRLSLPWPDLFGSTLITGFLIFLVTLFLDVLASNYTRVLWHAADIDFFAFGPWNFLIVNVWQFHCRGFSSQCCFAPGPVNELSQLCWITPDEQLDIIPVVITSPLLQTVHHFFDSEPLSLFTLWRHGNTLISQLVIHDFVASESSDTISTTSTAKLFCWTVFTWRSWSRRRTPPQSLHSWDSAGQFSNRRLSRPSTELIAHKSTPPCWLSDQLLLDHHELRLHIIQRSVRCHSRTSPRSLNSRPTCWTLLLSNRVLSTRLQHVYHMWTCLIAARDLLSTQRSDSPMWIVRSFCWFAAMFFDSMTAWCC